MHATAEKTTSLQDVMNQMAQNGIASNIDEAASVRVCSSDQLSELDAFIQMDPLLAALNKDYRQSKAERQDIAQMFGNDDPMTEVARDKEDSAWCAMQTRYLELRGESEKMREAQGLMRAQNEQAIEEVIAEKKREKEQLAQQLFYYNRMSETARERNKPSYVFELGYIMLFLADELKNLGSTPPTPHYQAGMA